jgi:adenosine deaminase
VVSGSLAAFIQAMPKVELHLHLEGSVSAHTLLALAHKNSVSLVADDVAGIERRFQYRSLQEFLNLYMDCVRVLVDGDDFARLGYELALELARQNVLYAEVMISAMQYVLRQLDFNEVLQGLQSGYARAERETGVVVRTVFDYGRQFGVEHAWQVLELAQRGQRYGVVGFSIGGDEYGHPPERFREVFAAASASGLRLMAHAGEIVGPSSVWGAVEALCCERIGHGISSIGDEALLDVLRERRVMLDVCPTSNLRTGAVRSLDDHPLRRLFDAGVRVSINSDDPTFFGTTLTDEFLLAADQFGFTADELCAVVVDSVDATFLPRDEQARLRARVCAEQQVQRHKYSV